MPKIPPTLTLQGSHTLVSSAPSWASNLLDGWLSSVKYGVASALIEIEALDEAGGGECCIGVIGRNYNARDKWDGDLKEDKQLATRILNWHIQRSVAMQAAADGDDDDLYDF